MNSEIQIETDRLFLRPIGSVDVEDVFNYRTDRITNKFQGWIPKTKEDVKEFITKRNCTIFNKANTWFQFVITLKNENIVVGDLGIHFLDEGSKSVELGCTLAKAHHAKGFANEAIDAIIRFLSQEYEKNAFYANIISDNKQSLVLFKRIGFKKIGEELIDDGKITLYKFLFTNRD